MLQMSPVRFSKCCAGRMANEQPSEGENTLLPSLPGESVFGRANLDIGKEISSEKASLLKFQD